MVPSSSSQKNQHMTYRLAGSAAVVITLLGACASVPAPAVSTQGDDSYLQITAAGKPLLQVDGKDGATCKALAAAALRKNPDIAPTMRCAAVSVKSQLPFTATVREAETNIEIASHFRTEVACKKYASDMAAKDGTTITRNCTRS
jgi:hypothetical protein